MVDLVDKITYQKILQPRMLSGHYQGRILSMISKLINPKSILEIGTYTGYSAICLAEGLSPYGELHTIEINDELELAFLLHVSKGGLENTKHFFIELWEGTNYNNDPLFQYQG